VSKITFVYHAYVGLQHTSWISDGDWTPPAGAKVPAVDICYVDGGRYRISSSGTSQGAHHRHFLVLMVSATGSLDLTPPRGPAVDVFYVDGGRFGISVDTS
jgi:hypothetical protein